MDPPKGDMAEESEVVGEDEEFAGMSVEDKALNRAWASGDMIVDDNFLLG